MEKINPPKSLDVWEKGIAILAIFVSLLVILGWFLKLEPILSIFPGSGTMKFNSALVFLLSGIGLYIHHERDERLRGLVKIIGAIVTTIGVLTLIKYTGLPLFDFDQLFVDDPFSVRNPGRMSPATAVCATLMGISFLCDNSEKKFWIKLGLYALKGVLLVSLVALIAFILLLPRDAKINFFNSMAIHTSILFLSMSVISIFRNESSTLRVLFFGKHVGSKSMRRLVPAVLLIPTVLSFVLVTALEKGSIDVYFGISAFAALSVPMITIYLAFVAQGLNKVDARRVRLQKNLQNRNNELRQYKHGLDRVANIAKTDKNGVVTYVNDRFCTISQYSRDQLVGKKLNILNSGHHPKSFWKDMYQTIQKGDIWYGHVKNKAKYGSIFWVEMLIIPFRTTTGEVYEYLSMANEITQRKKEELLVKKEYVRSLEFKNKELEELTYIASHDLQEPLITLLSLTSYLVETQEDVLDDEGKKTLQFIQDTSSRMSNQIRGILQYNLQFENLKIKKVDCNEIVKDIIQDFTEQIKEKKAEITFENLPTIEGYKSPLRMLFLNLISNALKFQQPNTKPVIRIIAIEHENFWKFTITDNGIGIEPHNLEKVFKIFQRLQKTSEFEGSGIGLAHCKKIIDLHSGNIWVESIYGVGSAFHFTVPINLKEIKSYIFHVSRFGNFI